VELTNADALRRCATAARRIVDELSDDGITVGAEEDAEAAILVVREMADRLSRAMDVHERPTLPLLRFGALLARAMAELDDDDGLTGDTARALDDAAREHAPTHPANRGEPAAAHGGGHHEPAARLRAALVALDEAAFVRVAGGRPAGTAARALLEASAGADRPALLAYEDATVAALDAARGLLGAVDPEGRTLAALPAPTTAEPSPPPQAPDATAKRIAALAPTAPWHPPPRTSPEAGSRRAPEAWSLTLSGELLDVLDALAAERDRGSPDLFGALGHRPGLVAEAVALGLRQLAAKRSE
jgi:hypothetical protein